MIHDVHRNIALPVGLRLVAMVLAIVVYLLITASVSHALTLDDMHGAVLLGHGLDVSVQVRHNLGEDVSLACFTAEVYYADTRQPTPRISVREPAPDQPIQATVVRIQLSELINEPVVTVVLTAACGAGTIRSYVLLADMPPPNPNPDSRTTAPLLGAAAIAPVVPQTSNTLNALHLPGASLPQLPTDQTLPLIHRGRSSTGKKSRSNIKTHISPDAHAPGAHSTGKSTLKLDPWFSDRMDSVGSSMLFAPTEDTLLHAKTMASLQTEINSLRAQALSNQASLQELRMQLQLAHGQYVSRWVVYGAGVLMLVVLASVVWLWQRQRQLGAGGNAWWHGPEDDNPATVLQVRPADSATFATTIALQSAPVPAGAAAVKSEVDSSVANTLSQSKVDIDIATGQSTLSASDPAPQTPSNDDEDRCLGSEYIMDIRQQADFFVSLGQVERAMDILCRHLDERSDPHPLVFLDLLALYHSLNLKADFAVQTKNFMRCFNCTVPDFEHFTNEGNDLESYTNVVSKIVRLWPGQPAMSMLDHCIYRGTEKSPDPFDLAAFRDLLTLRCLAEVVVTTEGLAPVEAVDSISPVQPVARSASAFIQRQKAENPPAMPLSLVHSDVSAHGVSANNANEEVQRTDAPLSSDSSLFSSLPSSFFNLDGPVNSELSAEVDPVPELRPLVTTPQWVPESVQESPSRMLDLDFSHLTDDFVQDPVPKRPVARYVTRTRTPGNYKPK